MLQPSPIIAHNRVELRQAIAHEIQTQGPKADLNHIDVSQIELFIDIFKDSPFDGNISKWDVSNAKDFTSMFCGSQFNGDISNWSTGRVISFRSMFKTSRFNGDLSRWDVSSALGMSEMFWRSPFNQDVSKWDVSQAVDCSFMFSGTPFNGDVSGWNVANIRDFMCMLASDNFQGDISNWPVHDDAKLFIFSVVQLVKQRTITPWLLRHYYDYHVGIEDPALRQTAAAYEAMELAMGFSTSLAEKCRCIVAMHQNLLHAPETLALPEMLIK